jgi:hypothetical protein
VPKFQGQESMFIWCQNTSVGDEKRMVTELQLNQIQAQEKMDLKVRFLNSTKYISRQEVGQFRH